MSLGSRLCAVLALGSAVCSLYALDTPVPKAAPGLQLLGVDRFDDSAAAAAAWKALGAFDDQGAIDAKRSTCPAALVRMGERNVLELTCNFASTAMPRAVWDRRVDCDFSLVTAVVLDVYATNLKCIGSMHLYLGTGTGWYGAQWYPDKEEEWCRIRIPKASFTVDRPGAGWASINTIRISPWAAACREDAVLRIANLGVERGLGDLLIVQHEFEEVTERNESNARQGGKFAPVLAELLEEGGLTVPVISSQDLRPALLARAKALFLPFASGMEQKTEDMLLTYLDGGGAILACFSLPPRLSARLGVAQQGYRARAYDGEFSLIRRSTAGVADFPEVIRQNSFAVIDSHALPTGRLVAWWEDADGRRTAPAFIASDSGGWFSHVLLEGDASTKTKALIALLAERYPSAWRVRWQCQRARAGASVSSLGWEAAVASVSAMSAAESASAAVLAQARQAHERAVSLGDEGKYTEASSALAQAEDLLKEAACRSWQPVQEEFRATWCHPPQGIDGWTWEQTAQRLAAAGIEHLFLNALNGASAAYPSEVMPYFRDNQPERDYLGEAIAGCAKYGIAVHVWICNYKLRLTPAPVVATLRAERRIAIKLDGSEDQALCPSHEANIRLQKEAMLEAALRPGVAGVHFDYIRYSSPDTCFCDGCRTRFQGLVGEALAQWPQEVSSKGKWRTRWLEFRRDSISRLVEQVHREVRAQAPQCRISAAVFRNYPTCRDSVGQDWALWARRGWVDFVCPMNYTASDAQFGNQLRNELGVLGGSVPCYPGIGLLEGMGATGAARQIHISRTLGAGGFVIWSVYPQYLDIYRYLGMGILPSRTYAQ